MQQNQEPWCKEVNMFDATNYCCHICCICFSILHDALISNWMYAMCYSTHIRKYAKYHSDSDHREQVKNVIKNLFYGAYEEEMDVTQELSWSEYTYFDKKIG